MTYEIKAIQLTDKGIIPLDYYKPEHFIQQEDASILLNKIFVKQYRRDYGEIIGVILHPNKKEKLPAYNLDNKGVLGILCV